MAHPVDSRCRFRGTGPALTRKLHQGNAFTLPAIESSDRFPHPLPRQPDPAAAGPAWSRPPASIIAGLRRSSGRERNGVRERFPNLGNAIGVHPSSLPVIVAGEHQSSRLEGKIAGCSAAGSLLRATQAAAGPDRSKHWKRSTPSLARSANAVPPASFPARAGLVPRSPARGTETIRPSQK